MDAPPPFCCLYSRGCHKDDHPFFFYYGIHSLMFGGYPPTAIGHPPTAISYTPTAISYTPTAIGYPPTAIGYHWLHTNRHRLHTNRHRLPTNRHRLPTNRHWLPTSRHRRAYWTLRVCFFSITAPPAVQSPHAKVNMRRTDVRLWHSTDRGADISAGGTVLGTRCDRNTVCGAVGVKKIWTCAIPQGSSSCCSHGGSRVAVTCEDLRNHDPHWRAYRTKRYHQGYRNPGNAEGHVFYNFFLVPASAALSAEQWGHLRGADLWDSDPVQLHWNDGDIFILERRIDETDTSTTTDDACDTTTTTTDTSTVSSIHTSEVRHFHVAVVVPALDLGDPRADDTTTTSTTADMGPVHTGIADGDTTSEHGDEDADGDTTSEHGDEDADGDTTSEHGDEDADGDTTSEHGDEDADGDTTSEHGDEDADGDTTSEPADENGVTCLEYAGRDAYIEPQSPTFASDIQALRGRPQSSFTRRARDLLRARVLNSVGTSQNALRHPERRLREWGQFDDALSRVLQHAGQRCRPLLSSDLTEWHGLVLAHDPARAGVVRTNTTARCGSRVFVRGPEVRPALEAYLAAVNRSVMPRESLTSCGKAAYCCYHMNRIHPLSDGNGRMARLMAVWALRRDGFPLLVALCAPGPARAEYIRVMREVDMNRGDVEALSRYVYDCCRTACGIAE